MHQVTQLARVTCAALTSVLACACAPEPIAKLSQDLVVQARTPDGRPVAFVQSWSDGAQLGATDSSGRLRTRVQGAPAQAITLSFACPAEYATPTPKRTLVLDQIEHKGARAPIALHVECRSLEINTAIVVRTQGAPAGDLPVRVRGEAVARTHAGGQAEGHAHAVVRSRPASTLRVELDTRTAPELRPESPSRSFVLGATDDVVVFDQTFTRETKRRKRTRAPKPAPAPTSKPYRID